MRGPVELLSCIGVTRFKHTAREVGHDQTSRFRRRPSPRFSEGQRAGPVCSWGCGQAVDARCVCHFRQGQGRGEVAVAVGRAVAVAFESAHVEIGISGSRCGSGPAYFKHVGCARGVVLHDVTSVHVFELGVAGRGAECSGIGTVRQHNRALHAVEGGGVTSCDDHANQVLLSWRVRRGGFLGCRIHDLKRSAGRTRTVVTARANRVGAGGAGAVAVLGFSNTLRRGHQAQQGG